MKSGPAYLSSIFLFILLANFISCSMQKSNPLRAIASEKKFAQYLDEQSIIKNKKNASASFLKSNETQHDKLLPAIKNLGGGYIGIGTEQNYTLILQAKSSHAWLIDYNPNASLIHLMYRAMYLEAKDTKDFLSLIDDNNLVPLNALIKKYYAGEIEKLLLEVLPILVKDLKRRLEYLQGVEGEYYFLKSEVNFNSIKKMYAENKIAIMTATNTDEKSFNKIIASAKELKVPIELYYLSNSHQHNYVDDLKGFQKVITLLADYSNPTIITTRDPEITFIKKQFSYKDEFEEYVKVHDLEIPNKVFHGEVVSGVYDWRYFTLKATDYSSAFKKYFKAHPMRNCWSFFYQFLAH